MTFPDDFVVPADRRLFQRQLGNAVPVELGRVVIQAVLQQLGHVPEVVGASTGPQQTTLF